MSVIEQDIAKYEKARERARLLDLQQYLEPLENVVTALNKIKGLDEEFVTQGAH